MPLVRRTVIRDEGTQQGAVNIIDFAGAGVSAAVAGGVATVTIGGGGAGSTTAGQSEIDFGAFPGKPETSLAVASAGITAGSRITLSIAAVATADHTTVEDVISEEIDVFPSAPTAGVGFTIYARSRTQIAPEIPGMSGQRGQLASNSGNYMPWGKYLVNWSYT